MKRFYYLIASFLTFGSFMSCKQITITIQPEIVGMQVADSYRDCYGAHGPEKCLQVKENGAANWQLFYNRIRGFTYEEGYEYELIVNREKVVNPPADGSSLKYTLVKEVSKRKR
jgi:hypothetical protein